MAQDYCDPESERLQLGIPCIGVRKLPPLATPTNKGWFVHEWMKRFGGSQANAENVWHSNLDYVAKHRANQEVS